MHSEFNHLITDTYLLMNEIAYIGEHLGPYYLGRLLTYLALVAGIFSLFFYLRTLEKGRAEDLRSRKLGRIFYLIQTFSIVGISATLFYAIVNHYFEYAYVFRHSSVLMPGKFIISSFWAGQEGSFLLWALFIGLYGIGAMLTARKLEGGVMSIVVLAQLILVTMILGLNLAGQAIGSNPFVLLRELPDNAGMDFFQNPNYVRFIADGNGLNPLLENPWMVIHPPMLFMGYATAIFPYAFAFASLVQGDKRYWLKPVLPWLLLSIGLLGVGLILGGAWAYQSLTFGGFWAWDPVENASLIPWMVQVAALHYMLLSYKRDKYYYGTYVFTFLGFITVIYASYLTRSGVLGETSVHAFGDDGRSLQLVLFLAVFILLPFWQLIRNRKNIRANDLPALFTREFLMMYGAIVMLLAAFQVISTTSVPVINKIFGTNMAPSSDSVNFYNTWQLPFAIMMTLLLAIGQYVGYGKNDFKKFIKNIIYPLALALVFTVWGLIADGHMTIAHGIFLFSITFTIFTSLGFLFRFASRFGNTAAGITHVGFGIFLLGVLITFSNTETISKETVKGMPESGGNAMLFKGQPKELGEYKVNYVGSRDERDETFHQVDFLQEGADGQLYHKFSLYPSIKYNSMMGNVHNPDTRNMLRGDIYMYITFAEDPSKRLPGGYTYTGGVNYTLGDTLMANETPVIFDSLYVSSMSENADHISIVAVLKAEDSLGVAQSYPLAYTVSGNMAESGVVEIPGSGVRLRFDKVTEIAKTINIGVFEKKPEFLVVKILYFPWIIVLWTGAIIMFAGIAVGVWRRFGKARKVVG